MNKLIMTALILVAFATAGFSQSYKKGDRILGQWDDGRWYPAQIIKDAGGGKFKVLFDDGDVGTIGTVKMRTLDWTTGSKVSCNWKNGGKYYKGTISKKDGDYVVIAYDDGDVEETGICRCRTEK